MSLIEKYKNLELSFYDKLDVFIEKHGKANESYYNRLFLDLDDLNNILNKSIEIMINGYKINYISKDICICERELHYDTSVIYEENIYLMCELFDSLDSI